MNGLYPTDEVEIVLPWLTSIPVAQRPRFWSRFRTPAERQAFSESSAKLAIGFAAVQAVLANEAAGESEIDQASAAVAKLTWQEAVEALRYYITRWTNIEDQDGKAIPSGDVEKLFPEDPKQRTFEMDLVRTLIGLASEATTLSVEAMGKFGWRSASDSSKPA